MKVISLKEAILRAVYVDSTRQLRFVMMLVEWCFIAYFIAQADDDQFNVMWKALELKTWAALFFIHSLFLLRGLTGRYNKTTLFGEGILGMFLWWITAITNWTAQGSIGPSFACAIAMTIILVNYPTHKDWGRYE